MNLYKWTIKQYGRQGFATRTENGTTKAGKPHTAVNRAVGAFTEWKGIRTGQALVIDLTRIK